MNGIGTNVTENMKVETTSCSYTTFKEATRSSGIHTLLQRIKIRTDVSLWVLYASGGTAGAGMTTHHEDSP